ncbi:MAG: alpha-L-rhamnosidase [Paenibacillus sp.]|nr:alpha-L-rhamnosidase [Paenibacillus sp.]
MDKQWLAKWIMDERFYGLKPIDVYHKEAVTTALPEHRAELRNLHMHVRKSLYLNDAVQQAHIDIAADDYYKLYVNGEFVGQGPAQANYYHYLYNRFDVAPYLRQGENVIAVHVYYHGLISRSYNSGDYRQGLIAELIADGSCVAQTDRTWKYRTAKEHGDGRVIGYDTQFLENIDSRLMEKGWRSPGFDDAAWTSAWEHIADDHRLVLQPTPPLSVYKVKPQKAEPIEGGYWLDFGSELTGQFTMRAKGASGQTVEIRCGEELLADERVRYAMRCNCTYQDTWTLSGEEDELELYDYKAFRYVEVLADPLAAVDPDSFAVIVRHYPLDEDACRFESSNELLNAIWAICKNGVKYGTQENYVDCPSREKGQYLGDNTVITHAHAYISGDLRMYRKSLEDFALLSARVCPGMMAVAPGHLMQEIADFSLQYPMQLLQYYRFSGDRDFLAAMYPVAERMIRHFAAYGREDGLLESFNDKWNLVDWPENLRDGYDFPLKKGHIQGCHNVINAFYYGALTTMSDIREALQLPQAGEKEAIEQLRFAFVQAFYDPEQKRFVDAEGSRHTSLHANVLPLLFGLAPDEAVPSIVQLIREKRLSCGVYMSYFVLKALARAEAYELLYELIVSDDLHSWSTMVKEGATTCFEAWSKELKWNTSLCHPWASGPIPLLIEDIFGIKPAAPGWKKVRFAPQLPQSLNDVKLAFHTPAGEIRFEASGGQAKLHVPDGVVVV